jgi:ABC-type lipoprotein export system ATPase subunit
MHALARHARAGNAVVIATHDTEVAQAASRVVRMRDGEIVR